MDYIVEDGTGKPDSNSYVELSFAQSYLQQDWSTSEQQEKASLALIRASEYADIRWGSILLSKPLNAQQALQLPRAPYKDKFDNVVTGVPLSWKKAVCLYAKEDLEGKLYPKASNKQAVSKKKITVGPITTDVEYVDGSKATDWVEFPLADTLAQSCTNLGANAVRKPKGVMRN